jgi:hypothetical protein
MGHETNQGPTQGQRSQAAKFEVAEEAMKRSQDRGLSVRRIPKG